MTSIKTKLRQFVAAIFAAFNKSRFRRILAAIFAAFTIFLLGAPVTAQDHIWLVDNDAAPGGDGTMWETAFNNLQDALDEAEGSFGSDLIRVAQGSYEPSVLTDPPDPRSASFLIDFNFVTIEGGYAGINEPDPDLRDVDLYVTTLSGEIGGPGLDDNAYHVMTIQDVDITVRIDGLRLIDGYADGDPGQDQDRGGGILILVDADPLIVQCTIFNCTAIDGGGIAILVPQQFTNASPIFVNCRFIANVALTGDGGGIFNFGGTVDLTNCIFDGCSALGGSGGAIFNGAIPLFTSSNATLVNCTITQCDAAQTGGLFTGAGSSTLTNCILWGNTNGQINNAQLIDVTATFSCIEGGFPHGPFEGPGQGNISDDPQFLDPDGLNDIPGDEDDDLRLAFGSPCNDAASNAALPPDVADLDADGDPNEPTPRDLGLLTRVTFDANESSPCSPVAVDMGAHENADCNDNGVRDELELDGNDVNGDGIPDDCQDCNDNGILDPDEIEGNDCNGNGILDECDILLGCAQDCDGDGIPDECDPSVGTNLRQFPAPILGNGRGMAFDGTYLYYTRCVVSEFDNCLLDAAIYQIDTDGALQSTIIPSCPGGPDLNRQIGALAFDDTGPFPTLWAATYDEQVPIIVQIDIATGDVLQTIDALPVNVNDTLQTYIDGLAFDPRDGSLYYSTDLGFEVFNIAASGGSGCTGAAAVQNPDKGYVLAEGDLSGHAFDGMFLYSAQPADDQGDGNSNLPPQIFRTFIDAPTVLLNFRALHMGGSPFSVEDLAFDSVTFPQKCAVWANRSGSNNLIAAFEVPCPCAEPCPADFDGDCAVGVKDLLFLLGTWGPCDDCADCPADFDDSCDVGVVDLLFLLGAWGPCECSLGAEVLSLAEELADACLTQDDWDEFVDVITDTNSSQKDKDRYDCWMTHYLDHCNKCTCEHRDHCPDPDPFS